MLQNVTKFNNFKSSKKLKKNTKNLMLITKTRSRFFKVKRQKTLFE